MKATYLLLLVCCFCGRVARAQTTYQWTNLVAGAADGSWNTGANWNPAGPAAGVDNTAQFNQPVTNSATLTLDGNLTIGNLFFGNTATNAIGWTINPGTPATSKLTLGVSSGAPTITVTNQSATLGAVLAGTQGFTLTGAGVLTLSAANTCTGLITVNSGALVLNNLNAITNGNSLNIADGAVVQPKLAGTYANVTTTLNGSSRVNGSFGGSLDFHLTGTETWPGQIILNSDTATIGSYGANTVTTLSGQLTGGGSLTFRPEGGNPGHTASFTLSNPSNNYAGSTTMQVGTAEASTTLKLGVKNALPVTTVLNLNRVGSSGTVFCDLGGFSQTVAGLTANFGSNAVINSSGTVATLTISNSVDTMFDGTIGASGKAGINLAKQGGAALTLNATNLYTGSTTISAGMLALNGLITGTSSLLLSSNATLQIGLAAPGGPTNIVVNGNVTLAGQISVSDSGFSTNTNYPIIYYTGSLTNNGVTAAQLAACAFTIDTSVPHVISLVVGQKNPLVQFSGTNLAVSTLTTNLSGILRGTPAGPIWYEVRDQTNKMWDFGALAPMTPWNITVRHLRTGTNTVTMFAQDGSGNFQSNSLQLVLNLGANPGVRPRPIPSEIWWGGIVTNSQLLDPALPWDYVKRFEDGFTYRNPLASAQEISFATMMQGYNTKFCLVAGSDTATPGYPYVTNQINSVARFLQLHQNNGIVASYLSHDYHMEDMQYVSDAHPDWPTNDLVAWWTGDLSIASTNYPYPDGLWSDIFNGYLANFPHLKLAIYSQPEYWEWDSSFTTTEGPNQLFYHPLTDTNNNRVLVNGTNVSFSFYANEVIGSFVTMSSANGHPYFLLQSDSPWEWYGPSFSSPANAANMRAMILVYEKYLQSRGAQHAQTCNAGHADTQPGGNDAQGIYYETNSLNTLYFHQRSGGRANRYLFNGWYQGIPATVAPETQFGSYTHLAMTGIKYLKGIADTNGNLEQLNITPTETNGTVVQLQLQNNGDAQCLPALAGQPGTVSGVNTRYFTTNGAEITTTVLTAEGFCFTNMLQPGAATNLFAVTLASGLTVTTNDNDSLEAFWNPQDPLGIVRDREIFSPPVSPLGLWNDADIGSVGVKGGSALSGTNFTLLGSGADVWGTNDVFHFVYQTNSGDGTLTARVTSQTATDPSSKAGVMIRASTASNAPNVFICVTPGNGLSFQNRLTSSGSTYNTAVSGVTTPYWMRLTRSGTTFTAQRSADGVNWVTVGSSNVTGLATTALWGLAATAHNNALASAATFDNVALPNAAPVPAAISNRTLTAGQTLTLTNTATDANMPSQTLTWSLLAAPANASLNSNNGIFTWRPTMAQAPSTNTVSVVVMDNGTPALSATNSFTVTVNLPVKPTLSAMGYDHGQFRFSVNGTNGPDYLVLTSTNLSSWSPLWTNFSPPLPFTFTNATTNASQRFYRVQLVP